MASLLLSTVAAIALLPSSAAYEFTNDKITTCARETKANNTPWLTANKASYICTDEQWDKYYDPATNLGVFLMNDDASAPAQAACPTKGHVIKCFVFASWGQVAGGPDACSDKCSTEMTTGSKSCCAKACTSAGDFKESPFKSSKQAKCSNNKWITNKQTKQCGGRGDGYCDCCPNCYDCVHPPNTPAPAPEAAPEAAKEPHMKSYVENRFCDCRKGIEVSPDYSPCWNSCVDCFGDDGTVAYMPEDVGSSCVGESSCYLFVKAKGQTSTGYWQKCTSDKASSCTPSSTKSKLPDQPKAKGMFLCGAKDEVVV